MASEPDLGTARESYGKSAQALYDALNVLIGDASLMGGAKLCALKVQLCMVNTDIALNEMEEELKRRDE